MTATEITDLVWLENWIKELALYRDQLAQRAEALRIVRGLQMTFIKGPAITTIECQGVKYLIAGDVTEEEIKHLETCGMVNWQTAIRLFGTIRALREQVECFEAMKEGVAIRIAELEGKAQQDAKSSHHLLSIITGHLFLLEKSPTAAKVRELIDAIQTWTMTEIES